MLSLILTVPKSWENSTEFFLIKSAQLFLTAWMSLTYTPEEINGENRKTDKFKSNK